MEKVVRIINMKDDKGDREYWMSKSPLERLEAVETLRKQVYPDIEDRVVRVLRVFHDNKLVKVIDCEKTTIS